MSKVCKDFNHLFFLIVERGLSLTRRFKELETIKYMAVERITKVKSSVEREKLVKLLCVKSM